MIDIQYAIIFWTIHRRDHDFWNFLLDNLTSWISNAALVIHESPAETLSLYQFSNPTREKSADFYLKHGQHCLPERIEVGPGFLLGFKVELASEDLHPEERKDDDEEKEQQQ